MLEAHKRRSILAAAIVVLLVSACGPQARTLDGAAPSPGSTALTRPKVITLAVQREPVNLLTVPFGGSPKTGGASNPRYIVHDALVVQDARGELQPQLAAEKPEVDKGTWRVNADGSMDMTWKLRPNVKWHDGAPFSSEDMLFAFTVKKDPDMPWPSLGRPELMASAAAPDPTTFTIHWSGAYVDADQLQDVEPLPRHLLEPTYRADKEAFLRSPWFTGEFIGLGPYRLARWEPGSHMEFARFDDYYQGRPPFDTVVMRFMADANTLVANVLSGAVDAVVPPGLDLDTALEVQGRWEGTGNQVRFDVTDTIQYVQIQYRPDYSRPKNGLETRAVRQGLYQAIDRAALVEVVSHSLAPVADSWYAPHDAVRREIQDAIPRFPYDAARAQQLLAQAGWSRDSTGGLVDGQSGERFDLELRANQGAGIEKEMNVIGDGWKAQGVQVQFNVVPPARVGDAEYAATFPGAYLFFSSGAPFADNRLHSRYIGTAANRWAGRNRGGYNNPRVDAVLDKLVVTIDPGQRIPFHRELLQEQMADVALMPLYWQVAPLLAVKGVKAPPTAGNIPTSNFIVWDRE